MTNAHQSFLEPVLFLSSLHTDSAAAGTDLKVAHFLLDGLWDGGTPATKLPQLRVTSGQSFILT
jgi:hypothetical protein